MVDAWLAPCEPEEAAAQLWASVFGQKVSFWRFSTHRFGQILPKDS